MLMLENEKYKDLEQTYNKVVKEMETPQVVQPPPKAKNDQTFDMTMLFKELQI